MVTIKEIAHMAGVSSTTVSNVLHGKTSRVSRETMDKIEKLLQEHNYIPRLGLGVLTNNSSRIICVLINTPGFVSGSAYENPFYGGILGDLEELLREKGYYIMIFSDKSMEEIEKMIVGWNADGIITISMPYTYCKKILQVSERPMVSIDMDGVNDWNKVAAEYFVITSEDEDAGRKMGEYLISRGIRRILYLKHVEHGADYLRYLGLKDAVRKSGKEIILEEKKLPEKPEQKQECYRNLLNYAGTDTALFFSSDLNAAEMISFSTRNGVKIPEDISIVGMDDNIFASLVYPALTTVKVNVLEKAQIAVDVLMKLIEGETCDQHIYKTKVQVIRRESVK